MATTYYVPSKSAGFPITINFGGFNATGLSAFLDVELQSSAVPAPTPITLPLTVSPDGLSGTYTRTGTEIGSGSGPGLYTGEARVTNGSGITLYSMAVPGLIEFAPTIV